MPQGLTHSEKKGPGYIDDKIRGASSVTTTLQHLEATIGKEEAGFVIVAKRLKLKISF